jgi:hypothetical protein
MTASNTSGEAGDPAIEMRALAAGLERAWADFRPDVLAAAKQVAAQNVVAESYPPSGEPWPPMVVPSKPGREQK